MLEASGPEAAKGAAAAGAAGQAAAGGGGHGGKNKLMNLLMQLRKVVNHPFMFPEADLNPSQTDDRQMLTKVACLAAVYRAHARMLSFVKFCQHRDFVGKDDGARPHPGQAESARAQGAGVLAIHDHARRDPRLLPGDTLNIRNTHHLQCLLLSPHLVSSYLPVSRPPLSHLDWLAGWLCVCVCVCVCVEQHVGHGFMRLDGSTCLARRKYEIAQFNSKRGDQFVYLLSTRAGALGITLTGADTVIMYDSDWNPTWDRQAHDRVHRIGQDKEVTIYQLLCKDTVEQRIFQRAAQKTSLNELVLRDDTTTKSANKEDVLSSGEVKKMLRCGVVKVLDDETTSITEEKVDELIAAAHARGDQAVGQGPDEDSGVDEDRDMEVVDVFNQKLAQVRCFDGKRFDSNKEAMRSIADLWAAELAASGARRQRVATVESVRGYQVKKVNRSAASAPTEMATKKSKISVKHDGACLYCGEGGAGLECCKTGHCHRAFHEPCLDAYLKKEQRVKTQTMAGVSCSQHQCAICLGKASGRGGVIFRCWKCPLAFCGDCLPDDFEPLDVRSGALIDQVKYLSSSVEYLVCQGCTKGQTRKMSRRAPAAPAGKSTGKRSKPEVTKEGSKGARKQAKVKAPMPRTSAPAKLSRAQATAGEMRVVGGGGGSEDAAMADDWHTQGPFLKARVRRAVADERGTVIDFADGTIVGYLPLELAGYISELTGRPAALWRVRYDDTRIGHEDLEEVEVLDAVESLRNRHFESRGSGARSTSPSKTPRKAATPKASPAGGKGKDADDTDVVLVDVHRDDGLERSNASTSRALLPKQKEAALSSRETPIRPTGGKGETTPPLPDAAVPPWAVKLAVAKASECAAQLEPEHL